MQSDQSPALGGSRRQRNPKLLRQLRSASVKKRLQAVLRVQNQGEGAVDTYTRWLLDELQSYPPLERANASEAISLLGDPRLSAETALPQMLPVPAGHVVMGSERHPDERPLHTVFVPAFHLARFPTTVYQYWQFVVAKGHPHPMGWPDGNPPQHLLNAPIVWVNARDAEAYCVWLSERTGGQYRLPTEPEWVASGRGFNDDRLYPWGNSYVEGYANTWSARPIEKLCAVGLFPNGCGPFGHEGLSGNVWEWTASAFWRYPYRAEDGREDLRNDRTKRLILGGSWRSKPFSTTLTTREGNWSTDKFQIVGFRVARQA